MSVTETHMPAETDRAPLALTRVIITTADATLAETLRPQCDLVLIKPISYLQLRDVAKEMRAVITATAD